MSSGPSATGTPFTGWRAVGAALLVLACTGLGRTAGVSASALLWPPAGAPDADGVALACGILSATATGGTALLLLVRGRDPRSYLALARPSAGALLAAVAASAALVVSFDALRWASTGSIVPSAWLDVARSAPAALLVISFAVAAPCFEEAFFRGFLHTTIAATRVGPWGAVAVTSLLFALAHAPDGPLAFADVLASAILLGVLRHRTGSIVPGVIAHALGNLQAIVVASILATG